MQVGKFRRGGARPRRLTVAGLLCVAAEAACCVGAAHAQTVPRPTRLEEVTVTARRRSERAQRVPTAITAISGKALARRGVINTNDLQRAVPNLTISGQQRNNTRYYLRGQTPGVINQGVHNNPSVTVYFLEVPTLVNGPGTFFDMADVQVLKGPQGTLFGRNTTGGAILFTPVRPRDDVSGYLQGRYGSYDGRELEGAVNLPLIPGKLDLRVSGATARRDGFTTNVVTGQKLDDRNYDSYRVSLRAQLTENLEKLLVLNGRMIDQNGTSAIPIRFNPNVVLRNNVVGNIPLTFGGNGPSIFCLQGYGPPGLGGFNYTGGQIPGCPANLSATLGAILAAGNVNFYSNDKLAAILARQRALGPRQFASDAVFFNQERSFDATDITTWRIDDDLLLKNIIGYRFNRVNQASDFAGTVLPLVRNTNTKSDYGEDALQQVTDELQLQGRTLDGTLRYILGAYFENSDPGQPTISRATQFTVDASYASAQPLYTQFLTSSRVLNFHKFNDKTESVFAHAEYDLDRLYPGLQLATGIRYTWDQRQASISQYNGARECTSRSQIFVRDGVPICTTSQRAAFAAPTWSVQLSEQFDSNTLAYLSLRRGFKTGGFNLPAPRDLRGNIFAVSFGPEYVFSTELGLKHDWRVLGASARTNVAAFHDVYTSIQSSFAQIVGGNIASVVVNAGKAHVDGLEIEQTIVPVENLAINGYVSLLRAAYASSFLVEGIELQGRQLPYAPIQKYGINAAYTVPLGERRGRLVVTGDWALTTHFQTADPLDPKRFFKGNENVNLRLDWEDVFGRHVDLGVAATNLLDRTYAIGGYPIYGLAGFRSNIYNDPRMVFGQLTYRWGPNAAR